MVAPWTAVWQRNIMGYWLPWFGQWMSDEYVRGAVSGVGLVTIVAGLRDLTGAFLAGPRRAPEPPADERAAE